MEGRDFLPLCSDDLAELGLGFLRVNLSPFPCFHSLSIFLILPLFFLAVLTKGKEITLFGMKVFSDLPYLVPSLLPRLCNDSLWKTKYWKV